VSRDIFIRTMSLIFTYSFFTIQSAALGDEILAINTILMQLWYIMAYGVDGFAYAAESLTGKYMGAKDKAGLKQAVSYLVAWGMGLGVVFSLIYYIFDTSLLRLFTDNPELIALGLSYFAWTAVAPLVNSFCFMLDGIYIGATVTGPMRDSMLISTFLIFLPTYYLSVGHIGNHALWLAMVAYMLARGLTLLLYAPKKIMGQLE
jgi:MATE family multidrug resistance protein